MSFYEHTFKWTNHALSRLRSRVEKDGWHSDLALIAKYNEFLCNPLNVIPNVYKGKPSKIFTIIDSDDTLIKVVIADNNLVLTVYHDQE